MGDSLLRQERERVAEAGRTECTKTTRRPDRPGRAQVSAPLGARRRGDREQPVHDRDHSPFCAGPGRSGSVSQVDRLARRLFPWIATAGLVIAGMLLTVLGPLPYGKTAW